METVDVVVLSGPPGVGKSSLAEEVFDQLCDRDVRHAVIDVDALCLSYPFRGGDPYNNVTAIENVASVWANFSRQGIDRLVLVRVVESRADVERLLAAVPGARATVCHLAASPSTVEERIRRREVGSSTESLAARGRQLAAMEPDAEFVDFVLETGDRALHELATELLARLGWIGLTNVRNDAGATRPAGRSTPRPGLPAPCLGQKRTPFAATHADPEGWP
jgi:predicted kinase